ncbi:MAG: hypothetical protein P4L51_28395 [Puia sp.]|nr:hypothetical protein [Puia sp.]
MKKAKIMLAGIAVLAVAGGALAFKAKMQSSPAYCYISSNTAGTCTTFIPAHVSSFKDNGATPVYFYTTTNNTVHCTINTECEFPATTVVGDYKTRVSK